jgi:hypothetical protein
MMFSGDPLGGDVLYNKSRGLPMSSRIFRLTICALIVATFSLGCGVRQFSGKKKAAVTPVQPSEGGHLTSAFGPFYASGQGGGSMTTPGCNSNTNRPCVRARASVGMPYQFDTNPNATQQGTVTTGNALPVPGPYLGTAGTGGQGAGRSKAASLGSSNRDLNLLERQPATKAPHVF